MSTPTINHCLCNLTTYAGNGTVTVTGTATLVPTIPGVVTITGQAYLDQPGMLWSGYLGVYPLDGNYIGTPGEVLDHSPNALDGQGGGGQGLAYCPSPEPGVNCATAQAFAAGSYIQLPQDSAPLTQGLTVSGWIQPHEVYRQRIIYGRGQSLTLGYNVLGNLTATIWVVEPDSSLRSYIASSTTTLSRGYWYHVAVTWTPGTGITLYVDGVQVAHTTVSEKTLAALTTSPLIGKWCDCLLQELRIIPQPLSSAWLLAEYQSLCGGIVALA